MKKNNPPALWLASQSARRKNILESLGFTFRVEVADVDETPHPGETSEALALRNGLSKARTVVSRIAHPRSVVIGADTVVAIDGRILGKPADERAALESLHALSGRTHEVRTGLALVAPDFGEATEVVSTAVTFRALSAEEIAAYARTREPYDKAGAYGIQGLAARFVTSVEGSYSNVMGLPIEALLTQLERLTGISVYAWF